MVWARRGFLAISGSSVVAAGRAGTVVPRRAAPESPALERLSGTTGDAAPAI
jgi:hypothetical protein